MKKQIKNIDSFFQNKYNQERNILSHQEQLDLLAGVNPWIIIGAAAAICKLAESAYEFGKGVVDGWNEAKKG